MTTKRYLIVCAVVSVVWVAALLLVPGVSDAIEGLMIGYLSSNA